MGSDGRRASETTTERRRRPRGRALGVTGAIAGLVVLLVVPTSLGAPTSGIATAPYRGSVLPSNDVANTLCAQARDAHAWRFDLKTGDGGVTATGDARPCPAGYQAPGATYTGASDGSVTAIVALPRVASGSHRVAVQLSDSWNVSLSVSDGGTPTCHAPLERTTWDNIAWAWNYSVAGGFADSAYSDAFAATGNLSTYSTASSANVSSVPRPFHLNATTAYQRADGWNEAGECVATSSAILGADALLWDATSQTYAVPYGAATVLVQAEVAVEQATDYGCGYQFSWYGPSHTSVGNRTVTCTSGNVTLLAFTSVASSAHSVTWINTSGVSNTSAWTGAASSSGSLVLTAAMSAHDRYQLQFTIWGQFGASNSWPNGRAAYSVHLGATGLGVDLRKISIT